METQTSFLPSPEVEGLARAGGANVAALLALRAVERPDQVAVRDLRRAAHGARGAELGFARLHARADRLAHAFVEAGLRRGDRVCLFVRDGVDLISIAYALFSLGAVPVLIDPGMGRRSLLACVERTRPRGLVGIATAHLARIFWPRPFESVEVRVLVGPTAGGLGGLSLTALERDARHRGPFPLATCEADDPAAVLFTSGSTGPPKGVLTTHGMFRAQIEALRALYGLEPGETDLACFPLFALLDVALGITSVFPELDPSHPARCRPEKIWSALEQSGATLTFGSPAIWKRVVPWCRRTGRSLTHLRRAMIAGAPVPPALVQEFRALLPAGADVHTPYGATECLPVASLPGREILELRQRIESGSGTCVGRVAPGTEVRLIRITDEPLAAWSDALLAQPGDVGEIVVRGPQVTREYLHDPRATALAKIPDGTGGASVIWHRIGDVGRFDAEGRLWYLGRVSHRLETGRGLLMPVPAENVFNAHPLVARTALVGVGARGAERPTLVVEPADGRLPRGERRGTLEADLRALGTRYLPDLPLERVHFKKRFPVDVRHNAKIHRGELKVWAERQAT